MPPPRIVLLFLTFAALPACEPNAPPATDPAEISAPPSAESAPLSSARFESALDGALDYPTRITVADDGATFVSDVRSGRVFGYRGGRRHVEIAGLDQPMGLAVRGRLLYVGSGGRGVVEVFDLVERRPVATLVDPAGALSWPSALAIAPDDGRVYVADSRADAVFVFDAAGAFVSRFGRPGPGVGELRFPSGVAVDTTRVVVGDQGNHRVQIFDREGRFVRALGESALESAETAEDFAGRFTRVQGVALTADALYVLDAYHGHVQAFDLDGTPRGIFGRRGDCDTCFGLGLDLAADRKGRLLVTDPEAHRWVALSAEVP